MFNGLFDMESRLEYLTENGDVLVELKRLVPWEEFRPLLETVYEKHRKSNAGRKPFDVVLMFKILILQSLYNLGDDAMEFQIMDRLSFMRFLGLALDSRVPDAKTIWLFRQRLIEHNLVRALFDKFDTYLRKSGFEAKKGQIVDASIVKVPVPRNTKDENEVIKEGKKVWGWKDEKRRQKDCDARFTKKNGKTYCGYKNHIQTDTENKFVRRYAVTPANTHDSQVFEELLEETNTNKDVFADSAYRSAEHETMLQEKGFRSRVQRKGYKNKPLTEREKRGNKTRSRKRSRVEHVFGIMSQRAGTTIVRSIGLVRATAALGLRNLAYNLSRYCTLTRQKTS